MLNVSMTKASKRSPVCYPSPDHLIISKLMLSHTYNCFHSEQGSSATAMTTIFLAAI